MNIVDSVELVDNNMAGKGHVSLTAPDSGR